MRSLDRCPKCQAGTIQNYSVRSLGATRTRYLKCDNKDCDHSGKEIVAIDELRRQVYSAPVATGSKTDCSSTVTQG